MPQLTITGVAGGPARWGEPVLLWAGSRVIATAEVTIDPSARCLHITHFRPLTIGVYHAVAVRRLALLEIMLYALSRQPDLHITFTLDHAASPDVQGMAIAAARASFLRSFGAAEITIVPDVADVLGGRYVVKGRWEPSPESWSKFHRQLAVERAEYETFSAKRAVQRKLKDMLRIRRRP